MPEGDPDLILEDMDLDGVDIAVMHPNLSLFGLYSDDHELSMAHARVYNDYIAERFTPVLLSRGPYGSSPDHRHRRCRLRDRACRGGRIPGDPASCDPARCPTTRGRSTRSGLRPRRAGFTSSSTPRPGASRSETRPPPR